MIINKDSMSALYADFPSFFTKDRWRRYTYERVIDATQA